VSLRNCSIWTAASILALFLVALVGFHTQTGVARAETNDINAICDTVQGIPQVECEALVELYNSTDGDNWTENAGWPGSGSPSDVPCTDWYGITCQNGVVTAISLGSNELSGALTSVPWVNFSHLVGLRLDSNHITGAIPPTMADMNALVDLWLLDNNLSGPIPEFGANCSGQSGQPCVMWRLLLARQDPGLTGALPSSIGNLDALRELSVSENQLTGPLPPELLNLNSLEQFLASDNYFTGPILDFSRLAGLRFLTLDGNCFGGAIPSGLGNMNRNLERLWLSNNKLEGPLPREVACIANYVNNPESLSVTLAGNMLYVIDEAAKQCLATTAVSLGEQTVPPDDLRIEDVGESTVDLAWSLLPFPFSLGHYEVGYTTTPDGELTVVNVGSKSNGSAVISGLDPDTQYYFYIRTQTPANGGQKNALTSRWSPTPVEGKTLKPFDEAIPVVSIYKELSPATPAIGEKVEVTVTMRAEGGAAIVTLTDTLPGPAIDPVILSGDAQIENGRIFFEGALLDSVSVVIRYEYTLSGPVEPGAILYTEAVLEYAGEKYISGAAVAVRAAPVKTLVALYVSGDNNLGEEGYTRDLFAKVERAQIPDDVAVLLLYDGPGNEDAYYYQMHDNDGSVSATKCGNVGEPFCGYELDKSMWKWQETAGSRASLQAFLARALDAYEPERFIVSLVGHGSGWSPDLLLPQPSTHDEKPDNRRFGGLLFDQNPENAISTRQLGEALLEVTTNAGRKIDLLYLDSCLMAMSEVAYEVRDSVDFLIASESTSWTSFRYDLHLQAESMDKPIEELAIQWIKNEESELSSETSIGYPYTYSLLDLRERHMEELLKREDELANWMIQGLNGSESELHRTRIRQAFEQADCFDSNQDRQIDGLDAYCDLRSFAIEIKDLYPGASVTSALGATEAVTQTKILAASQELQSFLQEGENSLVRYTASQSFLYPNSDPANVWSWEIAGGVSIYLPVNEGDDWKRGFYKPAYLQSVAHGKWDELLNAYWRYQDPPSPPDPCQERGCLPRGQGAVRNETSVYLPFVAKE